MLGPQVAVPAHVEADLPDAPPLDEVGRQVRRAVGDDRDGQDFTDATKPRTSPAGSEYASPSADSTRSMYSLVHCGKS